MRPLTDHGQTPNPPMHTKKKRIKNKCRNANHVDWFDGRQCSYCLPRPSLHYSFHDPSCISPVQLLHSSTVLLVVLFMVQLHTRTKTARYTCIKILTLWLVCRLGKEASAATIGSMVWADMLSKNTVRSARRDRENHSVREIGSC